MTRTFRPLDGVRVVDISHVIAGPFATLQLALLGAEVIKIENTRGGDMTRNSARGPQAFAALNAGKQKLSLDFDTAADHARAVDLVRTADVLVDNLRPGTLEAKGLGYHAMRAVNPRLVYCSISGFGRSAGAAGRPAYDHVVQGATGMTLATGNAEDPPTKIGFPLIDTATGMLAAFAIVSGLRERDRTGQGMLLDVTMAAAALQLMYPIACEALTDGVVPARTGNQAFSGSPGANIFKTRDGLWLVTAANTPAQLHKMLEVLGLGALLEDPRLFERTKSGGPLRVKSLELVRTAITARIAECDCNELERHLIAANVPASRIRTLPEFAREAEAAGQLAVIDLEDDGTTVRSTGLGFSVS